MTAAFDLGAYLARIRYDGEHAARLSVLRALHLAHPQAIPFENLSPLVGWPVRLDAESLQRKLVRDGRGGYCFEHNLLLGQALSVLGFRVTWLAARVRWNVPEGVVTPRTHMVLRVDIDDRAFLADVGFGGLTLTAPLALEQDVEQETPHETFRMVRAGDDLAVEARLGEEWKALYRFSQQRQLLPDYELASFYVSTHPDSHFRKGLIAARVDGPRRYALRNNELAVHDREATDRRLIRTAEALRATLEQTFRLAVPDAPEIDAALARIAALTPAAPAR